MKKMYIKKAFTYFSFHLFIKYKMAFQLSQSKTLKKDSIYNGKKIFIPIIETNHYQHHQILAIAKALELRGADILVLTCGEILSGCEIKSVKNKNDKDPCWTCRFYSKNSLPMYQFKSVNISDLISYKDLGEIDRLTDNIVLNNKDIVEFGENLSQGINDSIARYFFGAIPSSQEELIKLKRQHTKTTLISAKLAKLIDQKWEPDIVLNNMSSYSVWEPFSKYFTKNGERYRLISLQSFNFKTVVLQIADLFGKKDRFEKYIKSRENYFLTQTEEEVLNNFISERKSGNAQTFKINKYFDDYKNSTEIKIDHSKRNIFLFSNVSWDVGLTERSGLYKDVITWVLSTIELLKNDTNINLYIKPHPAEKFSTQSSLKGVSQIIKEKYKVLPNNIKIIEPELKINTYKLFKYIDLGVIFTGTLGLEMMLSGIPVVSTGKTTHHGFGFSYEPSTEEEYLYFLRNKVNCEKKNFNELRLFAYFYFIKTNIPWTLTKQAYADRFNGFHFSSLEQILPGKNKYLDHLCDSIMYYETKSPEAWPDKIY